MSLDAIPIHLYIDQRYHTLQIQKIVDGWRVEPKLIIERLTEQFREMGIFSVSVKNEQIVLSAMIHGLKNSPEIAKMVGQARREEIRKQRNRHTDG